MGTRETRALLVQSRVSDRCAFFGVRHQFERTGTGKEIGIENGFRSCLPFQCVTHPPALQDRNNCPSRKPREILRHGSQCSAAGLRCKLRLGNRMQTLALQSNRQLYGEESVRPRN